MTDLAIKATVSADGRQAGAELKKLAASTAEVKQQLLEAQSATKAAERALKDHSAATVVDAARQKELRDTLVALRAEELALTRQLAVRQQAMAGVTQGAGAARAAMTNLGQQISDVSMGLALGVNPATIFAQQAGQVAFALQGIGGAARGVGAFLGGPWGIALTTATVALSPFAGKLFEAKDGAQAAKDGTLSMAAEVKVALGGIADVAGAAFNPLITGFEKAIAGVERRLPEFQELVAKGLRQIDRLSAFGANVLGTAPTSYEANYQTRRGQAVARTRRQQQDAAFFDEVMGAIEEGNAAARGLEMIQQINERRQSEAKAKADKARQATKQLADENRRLAEAYNPLLAAQNDYAKALAEIDKAQARGIVSGGLAADARLAEAAKLRQARIQALGGTAASPIQLATAADLTGSLRAQVRAGDDQRQFDAYVQKMGQALGSITGRGFTDFVERNAQELGAVLGGGVANGFNRTMQRAGAFGGLLDRIAPGQGVAFNDAFKKAIDDAFRPVISGLEGLFKKVFGEGSGVGKALGQIGGYAGVGQTVAGIADAFGIKNFNTKGAVRGAVIGGVLFGPAGALVGSLAGFVRPKNPYADVALTTTVSGATGNIFQSRGGTASTKIGNSFAGGVSDALGQVASALGADVRAGLNLGSIGFSGKQYYFNPTGGDFKAAGSQRFDEAQDAITAAVANALAQGAIVASPRVQAALSRYASNVNQAVAEALKVRDLEQLLEARDNPFIAPFRDFERQARQRIDVARAYGFEVLEIERLNADQRTALLRDTLAQATGPVRDLLDEFRFGDRATGSVRQQLDTLSAERDRLAGLVRGGDTSQMDALAEVVRRIDDLQREAFGTTGEAAAGRASSAALLQELVDLTEARVRAAAEQAQRAAADQAATMQSMDGTLEDIYQLSRQQLAALQSIGASLAGGGGSYDWGLAESAAR